MQASARYNILYLWTVEDVQTFMKRAGSEISVLSALDPFDQQISQNFQQQKPLKLGRVTKCFTENRASFICDKFQSFLENGRLSTKALLVEVNN